MNRKIAFLVSANLLIGSFLGTYFAKVNTNLSYNVIEADKIIMSGTSDTVKLARATDLINQVIKIEPENPKALMIKALSLQRRGLTDEAIETYEKLTKSAASLDQYGHFNVGVLYHLKNDLNNAEVNYRTALQFNDGQPMFWSNLIKVLVQANKKAEAKQVLEDALVAFPKSAEFQNLMYLKDGK